MAWDHLAINKPHLVYIILGGFTSLFMLCSSFVKERLYIGEASVATLCGVIFGPHAANLIDPNSWGNVDQITLEFSRIVLVVQCFAVGVELPKYYMEKHWRSVTFLLIPVMTFGWLITSLFIWWMIPPLDWLQALCCAACVTATDPVLASSVVGKGKFAKRVPKHLRDLLSAESGCNDGMAFPFIYLALYIIQYRHEPNEVAFHWIVLTILYECVFGAFYGFIIGYIGRRGIRLAEEHDLIDRESFLVFYFVLALFCAGSGSILGVDDLLVGFAAGVGFSNDGWFTQKTEESHVSNVIDLLINLAYFVYFGTIVPWEQFNSSVLGTTPWRLVIIALFVIFFRRIPIMMALKPLIPDIKTWREALFAGHFGPIGVGAIFVAILARADLETGGTTPLAELPSTDDPEYNLIALIWPITCFLVVSSIIVHGSSIAVFTLGKRINTLTLTMSYTKADEEGPSWMNRLPRIASQSKSMSKMSDTSLDDVPPGTLPPIGVPGAFLRRQKDEDNPTKEGSRASSLVPRRRKKKWEGYGPGGPISQSAIAPVRRSYSEATSTTLTPEQSESHSNEEDKEIDEKEAEDRGDDSEIREQHKSDAERHPEKTETYEEGDNLITEDADGNVITVQKTPQGEERDAEIRKFEQDVKDDIEHPGQAYQNLKKRFDAWLRKDENGMTPRKAAKAKELEHKRGPALAYQFGNTIIVEDEDGEVVKKYDLPTQKPDKKGGNEAANTRPTLGSRVTALTGGRRESVSGNDQPIRQGINRMGTWTGLGGKKDGDEGGPSTSGRKDKKDLEDEEEEDDRRIRFTIGGSGKRMTKEAFLKEIQSLDPKARAEVVASSNASPTIKALAEKDAVNPKPDASRLLDSKTARAEPTSKEAKSVGFNLARQKGANVRSDSESSGSDDEPYSGPSLPEPALTRPPRSGRAPVRPEIRTEGSETAAERRRRLGALRGVDEEGEGSSSSTSDPVPETPAERRRREAFEASLPAATSSNDAPDGETPAERRRREAALGVGGGDDESDSDDDNTERVAPVAAQRRGIRFAEEPVRGRK